MKPACVLVLTPLLAWTFPCGVLGPEPVQDAIAREWRARNRARDPEAHAADILEALGNEQWTERFEALDALRRQPRAARWLVSRAGALAQDGVLAACLCDPHPNVRATALDLCTRAGFSPSLGPEALEGWLAHPAEGVRSALARHLALTREPEQAAALLARLAAGTDGAAGTARRLLLSAGPAAWREQGALLEGDPRGIAAALREGLSSLKRAPVAAPLVSHLRLACASDPAGGTLVECLALHGELDRGGAGHPGAPVADRERLLAGWLLCVARDGDYRSERLARAARLEAAREGDAQLGRLLLAAAVELAAQGGAPASGDAAQPLRWPGLLQQAQLWQGPLLAASFLARSGTQALPALEALQYARHLPADLAREVWDLVELDAGLELGAPQIELLAWFLAPQRERSLRFTAATVLAEVFTLGEVSGPGVEGLFLGLLSDPDTELRASAFRWLCNAPGLEERLEALHESWLRFDGPERGRQLRCLPRDRPSEPFLNDLLALCAEPEQRTAPVLELLAPFRDRARVADALGRWLDEALAGIRAAPSYRLHLLLEWQAKALVLALGAGDAATLGRALQVALEHAPSPPSGVRHDPELAKTSVALLATHEQGRELLWRYLAPRVPRRIRLEAGIGLCSAAEPERAVQGLIEDYAGCDSELAVRVLDALGRAGSHPAARFLGQVGRDPSAGIERRVAALDALASCGAGKELTHALEQIVDASVLVAAADAFASLDSDGARAGLAEAWSRRQLRRGTQRERQVDAHVMDELWLARLRCAGLTAQESSQTFAVALGRAGLALNRRFSDQEPGATAFHYRTQLIAAQLLAGRGQLRSALEQVGAWWRLEGELLMALADIARGEGQAELEVELLGAALLALGGEPRTRQGQDLADRAALGLMRLALTREDWAAAQRWAAGLLLDARTREGIGSSLTRTLGRFDRPAGIDPFADLDAARWQAAAWGELREGRVGAAREHARRADLCLGASAVARETQGLLRRALER